MQQSYNTFHFAILQAVCMCKRQNINYLSLANTMNLEQTWL